MGIGEKGKALSQRERVVGTAMPDGSMSAIRAFRHPL
jgi:hypothetical protein